MIAEGPRLARTRRTLSEGAFPTVTRHIHTGTSMSGALRLLRNRRRECHVKAFGNKRQVTGDKPSPPTLHRRPSRSHAATDSPARSTSQSQPGKSAVRRVDWVT
ncbi:hypothetical protein LX82_02808 [Celeribacter halophilus]|uniref:Uncharacterized protein n=1 Tax=Celeribacter halophilus TaxID=576117 RepID=A0A1I3V2R2_9RHOB|nr:hypothetical protein LX82_02808 [Celeribacter halophilus]SFJ89525.1 hypothetical protein SAMN04488138_11383 [Celeribacter halophilus]